MQEASVRPLGQEDPLEKRLATHSSILAWRIPWTEEPGGLPYTESQRIGHSWTTNAFTSQLLFGVGLVSAVGRGEPALCKHSPSFWISSPCRSAESTEQSSLTLQWGSSVACFKYFIHRSVCSFPRCTHLLKRWSSLTEWVETKDSREPVLQIILTIIQLLVSSRNQEKPNHQKPRRVATR